MFQNEQGEECINKGWEPLVFHTLHATQTSH